MRAVIQHEFYRHFLQQKTDARDLEADAAGAHFVEEKVYGDEGALESKV
jgi:hypothetical protein